MKIDFHVHTKYSMDCRLELKVIAKTIQKKGLDGVAITDHNTMKGALIAEKDIGKIMKVIKGMEICTDTGDITALFIEEEIKSRHWEDVIDEIKSQGGLSVLPHPYRSHHNVEHIAKSVDIIEVFNASSTPTQNALAHTLACKLKKPLICGSDAHTAGYLGICWTEVSEPVYSNLIRGNTKVIETYPPIWQRFITRFQRIASLPSDKKKYYITHPKVTISKILKRII